MSIIAQMSPAQYAQMREQMLREQMLEQLNQLSPPPTPATAATTTYYPRQPATWYSSMQC